MISFITETKADFGPPSSDAEQTLLAAVHGIKTDKPTLVLQEEDFVSSSQAEHQGKFPYYLILRDILH